jgi:O-antigen ligase
MRAVAVMLFAYVWRVQDTFPLLGKIQLPLLAAGTSLVLFAADRHPWRRLRQLRSPLAGLTIALLVIMCLGVPLSLVRGLSAMFVFKGYMPNLVLMALVATTVRSERDIEWYAEVNIYGALLYATVVNLFFHVGQDGRLGDLVYYDANDFALIMVCSLPFAVYFLRAPKSRKWRPLGMLAIMMFMIGIVKSGSRGGFLALVAVLLYIVLKYRALPVKVRLSASVAGVVLLAALGSTKYWTMMSSILHPQSDYNWSGESGRREVWKRGIGYMLHNPVLGVGVKTFPTAEGRLNEEALVASSQGRGFKWSVAHNSFIETGAELGIPGLCVFIAMIVVTLRGLSRLSSRRRHLPPWIGMRVRILAQMITGSLVGFVIAGFFVSAEYFSYLYFLFGLSLGLQKLVQLRLGAVQAAPPDTRLSMTAYARMQQNADYSRGIAG